MKTALVKILTCVVVYVLTFGVLPNWVGDVTTAHAGAPPQGDRISVPAGTRILVRLSEPFSTANQRTGARFTGQLDANLTVQGVVAAPRGTPVRGQVVSVGAAGRLAGGSQLALELTEIVINNTATPLVTNTFQLQGQGPSGQTTRSAGSGAARPAGSGGGQQPSFAQGTLLEFRLRQPASLPRPQ